MTADVVLGDCLDVMRGMADASVDAVVTDPPYGLKFMGKHWDHGVPGAAFWTEALRLAKPGAYLLAFGGTRTSHRLTCAIEDAGWQIQDSLCWLFGSGFPKHKSKLKPAYESITMAWKSAARATPLNIDACRIETNGESLARPFGSAGIGAAQLSNIPRGTITGVDLTGRWPANVVLDEVSAELLDAQSGTLTSGGYPPTGGIRSRVSTYGEPNERGVPLFGASVGGASRFFYCAKSSRAEREAGLEGFGEHTLNHIGQRKNNGSGGLLNGTGEPTPTRNPHPCVKPVALMRWLVRLVTPPNGVVLDPFCGSGTTGIACAEEGRSFVGIEREAEYCDLARARIAHVQPRLAFA